MSQITPTIGRRIWYFKHRRDSGVMTIDDTQPCDAGIVFVHPDGKVNLQVNDHRGFITGVEEVEIIPLDVIPPSDGGYAQWMPYQVKADADRKTRENQAEPNRSSPSDVRVTLDDINALKARVIYSVENRPLGTTSTFVHAYLDGTFYLATGHSACVDPANYDQAKGEQFARKDAEQKVTNKLWELEGYALYKFL
ncbi:Gp49 family protein [Dyella sp. ASV21]|uniref:Gp49 family protein n=1 Tax=Dyella sp. ASV21 TaxID=2795114 RepID=UPI0018EBC9F5|nr:Gp49 family protein [Dyella sp. ASV21]